jgi:DNA-binding CsgD family transcriptional regulator
MTRAEPINKLLGTLYAAPLQPELWTTFLEQLTSMSCVSKAALITHCVESNDHRILASVGDSIKSTVQLYENHYAQFDEWTLRYPKRGVGGKIIQGESLWEEASFRKSVFYNEFLTQVDVFQMAGTAITGPGIFDALSFYRGQHEDPFDSQQLASLQMIVPHLRLALATRRRLLALESRVSTLENAFDHLKSAIVLVDRKGKAVLVNKTARLLCDQRDGLLLTDSGLRALNHVESGRLGEIIAKAIKAGSEMDRTQGGAMLISRINKRSLQVFAAPYVSQDAIASGGAVAMVFIADPESRPSLPSEILSELYGLTQAETRLALSLLNGNTLSQAADLFGVGLETVRSQIKSIFLKTNTQRQGELITLLENIPGRIS